MIDNVYLLNLPECTERRRRMEEELRKAGLPNFEIHGISGRNLSEETKRTLNRDRLAFYEKEYGRKAEPLTRGQLGCFLTHREIAGAIVDAGCRLALVVEDDIRFNDTFSQSSTWVDQLDQVDSDWDLVFLNCVSNVWPNFDWTREMFPEAYMDQPTSRPNLFKCGLSFGTNSQMVSRRGAKKLMTLSESILEAWDLQLHLGHSSRPGYAALPRLNIYRFMPPLTTELSGQVSRTQAYV